MTAPAPDPYLLPLPGPASPVVLPHLAGTLHAGRAGRYSDPVWSLAPLTDNPSTVMASVRWEDWPAAFEGPMRLAAWNLINGQLRPGFLLGRSANMRARVSMGSVYGTIRHWKRLADWLAGRGIPGLAACGTSVLHEYGRQLAAAGYGRSHTGQVLSAITRLWALDQLSARPNGIGRPPWEDTGTGAYLPAAGGGGGENSTEPLSEQTMGPLLTWAMRLVDDLSGDILAAWAERQRLAAAAAGASVTPAGQAALDSYLRSLAASGTPLPSAVVSGKAVPACTYIGGITGAERHQVSQAAAREGMVPRAGAPCPLDIPVTGRIAGQPWREALDFNEAPVLMRHLGTAAFIVCAYLTGMRPGEILGLRTGCCPEPAPGPGGQPGRSLIRASEFKNAVDDDGNHLSAGAEREVPWVAIPPVVSAIRVLERMVPPGHLLFSQAAHDRHAATGTGALKAKTIRLRMGEFTAWANREAARHGLAGEEIPDDPNGAIGTARFRRSLAWHIARRPNGLVALAIQYGHMRTGLEWASEGYAARSRGGIHDLIDLETARAVADTVAGLHDDLEDGGGVSGPSARRVIRAAAAAPRFAGTPITLASARKLLKNEDALVYDNPGALVLCHYKRDKALCHRDGAKDTPSLDRCVPGCGNIARTDQQAARLRERAAALETQAAHVPRPVGDRLRATAARLRGHADTHDRERITTGTETR